MAKRGRPPVQHIKHVHTIALSPETEELLTETKNAFIAAKGIRAIGEAAKGVLSHPAGLAAVLSGLGLAFLMFNPSVREGLKTASSKSKDAADSFFDLTLGMMLSVLGAGKEEKDVTRNAFWDALQEIAKSTTPFPGLFP